MKIKYLLSKIISTFLICFFLIFVLSALVGAEQILDPYEKLYSELNNFEESHIVSRIFLDFGPAIFLVLNENTHSLSYQEKIGICLNYLFEETGPDYGHTSTFPMDAFKSVYFNIFGEELQPQVGSHFYYDVDYLNEEDEIWVNEDSLVYLRNIDLSQFRYGVYYLKDYSLSENELTINIAVGTIDEDKDQYIDEDLLKDIQWKYHLYFGSSQAQGGDELGGYHFDRNFFQNSVDHTIWEEYSEYFKLYTMRYEKDADGYWHWTSCYLLNPYTDDSRDWFYPLLLLSAAMIMVLILKRRKAKY